MTENRVFQVSIVRLGSQSPSRHNLQPFLLHQREQFERGSLGMLFSPLPFVHQAWRPIQVSREDRLAGLLSFTQGANFPRSHRLYWRQGWLPPFVNAGLFRQHSFRLNQHRQPADGYCGERWQCRVELPDSVDRKQSQHRGELYTE